MNRSSELEVLTAALEHLEGRCACTPKQPTDPKAKYEWATQRMRCGTAMALSLDVVRDPVREERTPRGCTATIYIEKRPGVVGSTGRCGKPAVRTQGATAFCAKHAGAS